MNKILLIAKREFLSRVQKKTFLLTTIGLPLIIFVFYGMIIYFSVKTTDNYKIAVADNANIFNGKLFNKDNEIVFEFVHTPLTELQKDLETDKYDAYLFVPATYVIEGKDTLQFRSNKAMGIMTRDKIQTRINLSLIHISEPTRPY